jgi:23S rRNA pseudouridine1911/1915/1917 synthase
VHRLDKDTSGLVVIAKTEKFRSFYVKQLMNREVQKSYEAIVVGQVIGSMSIELGIERDPRNRIKMRASELGREAISHVSLIQFLNGYSHIEVKIETGRTHQIRVHLSSYKHPIIGDHIYNPRNILAKETPKELISQIQDFPRQALHAKSLCFKRMNGKENFEFESCIPDDMQKLISSLQ